MEEGVRHRARALRDSLRSQLASLAAEVYAIRRDAGFQEALRTMAAFWRYSPVNQLLIRTQRQDATRVAGRKMWERLERRVKPGEKPILVLAPTRGRFGFVEVPVFDVKQTRGRRLAVLRTELRGRSRHVRTEADATAYVVLRALGLEAPAPAYIAWQGGDGATVLRSMTRIQRAARRILEVAGASPP